jgi:hypothetical protein
MTNFSDYQKRNRDAQQRLVEAFAALGRLLSTAFHQSCDLISAYAVDHEPNRRARKAFRKGNRAQCLWYVQNRAKRIVAKHYCFLNNEATRP